MVDEASRFIWTVVFNEKSEAMKEVVAFQKRIQTQFQKKVSHSIGLYPIDTSPIQLYSCKSKL
jgi:hypothetical protein